MEIGTPFVRDQGGVGWEASIVRESVKFVLGEGLIVQLDGTFQFEASDSTNPGDDADLHLDGPGNQSNPEGQPLQFHDSGGYGNRTPG